VLKVHTCFEHFLKHHPNHFPTLIQEWECSLKNHPNHFPTLIQEWELHMVVLVEFQA
jgi:hypothetical protein